MKFIHPPVLYATMGILSLAASSCSNNDNNGPASDGPAPRNLIGYTLTATSDDTNWAWGVGSWNFSRAGQVEFASSVGEESLGTYEYERTSDKTGRITISGIVVKNPSSPSTTAVLSAEMEASFAVDDSVTIIYVEWLRVGSGSQEKPPVTLQALLQVTED